jgi:carotenoid 1,2-hydratase
MRSWHWSRTSMADGDVVFYDVLERDGHAQSLALKFGLDGTLGELDAPATIALPKSAWRLSRMTRSEDSAGIQATLEDTPFYVRSIVNTRLHGVTYSSVHESLDLDRFRSPWIQAMLPFRMRRWALRSRPPAR